MPLEVTIDSLGHMADGIAQASGGPIYVAGALPGEKVSVEPDGERAVLRTILDPSPDRVAAPCPHFRTCGGCSAQHMSADLYRSWKRDLVVAALAARGISVPVGDLVTIPPHSRRRATFAARRTKSGTMIGFHGRRSGEIFPVSRCTVMRDEIVHVLPRLDGLLRLALSRRGEAAVAVTASPNGLDIAISGAKPLEGADMHQSVAGLADELDLARLTWNGEVAVARRGAVQSFGGIDVELPPGGFLQAVAEAEEHLRRMVVEAVGDAGCIADLFSGSGTFALPLARRAAVHAVEADAAALDALRTAADRQTGFKPVTTERRDLFRRPLLTAEFRRFEAVVFDPPRAGAREQCAELAGADVPVVVGVSCNPATFARDARTLIDGGYRLDRVSPVDQFLYSHHVELVGVFSRE